MKKTNKKKSEIKESKLQNIIHNQIIVAGNQKNQQQENDIKTAVFEIMFF